MASAEVVKYPGYPWSEPHFEIRLLAVDFNDCTYVILVGDEDKYNGKLVSQLREPMLTLLEKGKTMELQHEKEDEKDAAARKGIFGAMW